MTLPALDAWQKSDPKTRSYIFDCRTGNYVRYILDSRWWRRLDQSGPLASNFDSAEKKLTITVSQ